MIVWVLALPLYHTVSALPSAMRCSSAGAVSALTLTVNGELSCGGSGVRLSWSKHTVPLPPTWL